MAVQRGVARAAPLRYNFPCRARRMRAAREFSMYRFNLSETFQASPREVLQRSMVDFTDYVKFMPNVSRIQVLRRETGADGREHITIQVFASANMPAVMRPFMGGNDMDWKEHYVVDHEKLTADWQVETPVFTEYVDCRGTSWVEAHGGGAHLVITGAMTIDHKGWTGFGGNVARKLVEIIEPFIGRMVTKNLQSFFRSIKKEIEKEAWTGTA
jgi:hypothetical protein